MSCRLVLHIDIQTLRVASTFNMPPRPNKRTKKELNGVAPAPAISPLAQSRLFAPFRALGYITDHVPFSMFVHTPKGALAKPTVHVVTSVGRSWLMWDAERMTLLFAGERL